MTMILSAVWKSCSSIGQRFKPAGNFGCGFTEKRQI